MEKIYEVIKIKQIVKEIQDELKDVIYAPSNVIKMVHCLIGDDDREVFLVICLNTNQNVIAVHRCHIGSLDSTIMSPREVFKACILNNARSFIVAHNHPSTHLKPSNSDFEVTKALRSAGQLLDIPLLDHIIINTKGDYLSFKEEGFLRKDRVVRERRKNLPHIYSAFK